MQPTERRCVLCGCILLADLRELRETLTQLAQLGGGTSDGNRIAQAALAKLIGGDNG